MPSSPKNIRTASPTTSAEIPAKASSRGRKWVLWGAVSVLGLFAVLAGGYLSQASQNSVARTAMVVTDMQAGVQTMAMEAYQATRGNPGAIDGLRSQRARVSVAMTLLEKGGLAVSTDPAPVLSLEGRSGFPLEELRKSLEAFDTQARILDESAAQIREAATAEAQLSTSLDDVGRLLGNISRNPRLSSGSWGSALAGPSSTLARPEMRTMRVIYSPLRGADALQSSWAQQFGQTSLQLQELAASAQADQGLSSSDKRLVVDLAAAAKALAESSGSLAQLLSARLAAQQLQSPLQDAIAAVQKPLGDVGSRVLAMQASRPMSLYVSWLGAVLVFVGILGLMRSAMSLSQDQWAASQETQVSHGLAQHVDRLTRHLRRIVTKDGTVMGNGRLEEDSKSPTFALASMINRILDNADRFQENVSTSTDNMTLVLSDATGSTGRIAASASRLSDHANKTSSGSRAIAQDLARLAQANSSQQAHKMVEMTTEAELVMQEGTFKMDAMRETVQATSKRLKRLAESAQGIATATTVIDNISRRVKVLSMNAAIEAAAHGENGRKFAVLAKEIERLSQSAHEAAEDIGRIVQVIQTDAQETVAAMEQSTAEVVASTEMTVRAGQSMREIGRSASDLMRDLDLIVREVEKQAVNGVKLSEQCDEAAGMGKDMGGESEQLAASLEKARGIGRDMKKTAATGIAY